MANLTAISSSTDDAGNNGKENLHACGVPYSKQQCITDDLQQFLAACWGDGCKEHRSHIKNIKERHPLPDLSPFAFIKGKMESSLAGGAAELLSVYDKIASVIGPLVSLLKSCSPGMDQLSVSLVMECVGGALTLISHAMQSILTFIQMESAVELSDALVKLQNAFLPVCNFEPLVPKLKIKLEHEDWTDSEQREHVTSENKDDQISQAGNVVLEKPNSQTLLPFVKVKIENEQDDELELQGSDKGQFIIPDMTGSEHLFHEALHLSGKTNDNKLNDGVVSQTEKCDIAISSAVRIKDKNMCDPDSQCSYQEYSGSICSSVNEIESDDKPSDSEHGNDVSSISRLRRTRAPKHHKCTCETDATLSRKQCKITKVHTCGICARQFVSKIDFRNHLVSHRRIGKERVYPCQECGAEFANKMRLTAHNVTHRNDYSEDGYSCASCCKKFAFKYDMEKHVANNTCDPSKQHLTRDTDFRNHLESHVQSSTEKGYSCEECGAEFAEKMQLTAHNLTHQNYDLGDGYACAVCSKQFTLKGDLEEHVVNNTCNQSPQHLIREIGHLKSRRRPNTEKGFSCKYCGAEFANKMRLTAHHLTHSAEKKLKLRALMEKRLLDRMPNCDRGTVERHNLDSTCKGGTTEERVFDSTSNQSTQPLNLGIYFDNPLQCHQCGEKFANKMRLTAHHLIHTQEGYTCATCSKKFAFKSEMETHVLSNTCIVE